VNTKDKNDGTAARSSQSFSSDDDESETATAEPVFVKRAVDPEQAFEDFYLRQATTEFANDLDKLRAAGDFDGTKSVPMLIGALRQGTACFGKGERVRIGRANGGL